MIGKLLCWVGIHTRDTTWAGTKCFGYLDWRPTCRCRRCGKVYLWK